MLKASQRENVVISGTSTSRWVVSKKTTFFIFCYVFFTKFFHRKFFHRKEKRTFYPFV